MRFCLAVALVKKDCFGSRMFVCFVCFVRSNEARLRLLKAGFMHMQI